MRAAEIIWGEGGLQCVRLSPVRICYFGRNRLQGVKSQEFSTASYAAVEWRMLQSGAEWLDMSVVGRGTA
jgi:hypothetical protein